MKIIERSNKVKIRKSVRKAYIIVLLFVMVLSVFALYDSFNYSDKENFVKSNIYEFTNKYSYSYDVSLVDNQYISEKNIGEKNIYVTDLMDKANITMQYIYNSNQKSNIEYTYQITGKLEAVYKKDGESQKVLTSTDTLIKASTNTVEDSKLEILENFDVNLHEKVQKMKNFQQELGIQVETTYTISMEVTTITNILEKQVVNNYAPDIVFEITPKTTKVKTNTEDTNKPQVVSKMVERKDDSSQVIKIVATIVLCSSIVGIILILTRTVSNNTVKNEYKIELNKILKNCEEKIVEVNEQIETEDIGVVNVKEFDEIIKVSEELFKPILYWNNELEEESWFCVIGNNIIYRFILKR